MPADYLAINQAKLPGLMVADEQGEYRLAARPERLPATFTLIAHRPVTES